MRRNATSLLSRIRTARFIWVAALAVLSPVSGAMSDTVSEQELKAAVLYRAARFIEWPASSFAGSRSPFVICVVGTASVLEAFEAIRSKQIHARSIAIRQVTGDMLDVRQCHIAYFPTGSDADIDYALGKSEGLPLLTVGDAESFVHRGGMIALITRDQRIHFTVNVAATKRGGLIVSSQLLQLATVIEDKNR
jgi:hypothetical protein